MASTTPEMTRFKIDRFITFLRVVCRILAAVYLTGLTPRYPGSIIYAAELTASIVAGAVSLAVGNTLGAANTPKAGTTFGAKLGT